MNNRSAGRRQDSQIDLWGGFEFLCALWSSSTSVRCSVLNFEVHALCRTLSFLVASSARWQLSCNELCGNRKGWNVFFERLVEERHTHGRCATGFWSANFAG